MYYIATVQLSVKACLHCKPYI